MRRLRAVMSLLGAALGTTLIVMTLSHGNVLAIFINEHGIVMVFGGTLAATMISTPANVLSLAMRELKYVFFPPKAPGSAKLTTALVSLAAEVRRDGLIALQKHMDQVRGQGDDFLVFAVEVALENGSPERLRKVLEDGIRQREGTLNRAASVFQTMAFLGPMFGLLGTVMGIVGVLKELSNPSAIGPAMAIALTTAFYGILVAAFIANPIALRIRARAQEVRRSCELVMEGLLGIVAGAVPLQIERHLKAYAE
jgi:chemotaxis protein MotA